MTVSPLIYFFRNLQLSVCCGVSFVLMQCLLRAHHRFRFMKILLRSSPHYFLSLSRSLCDSLFAHFYVSCTFTAPVFYFQQWRMFVDYFNRQRIQSAWNAIRDDQSRLISVRTELRSSFFSLSPTHFTFDVSTNLSLSLFHSSNDSRRLNVHYFRNTRNCHRFRNLKFFKNKIFLSRRQLRRAKCR